MDEIFFPEIAEAFNEVKIAKDELFLKSRALRAAEKNSQLAYELLLEAKSNHGQATRAREALEAKPDFGLYQTAKTEMEEARVEVEQAKNKLKQAKDAHKGVQEAPPSRQLDDAQKAEIEKAEKAITEASDAVTKAESKSEKKEESFRKLETQVNANAYKRAQNEEKKWKDKLFAAQNNFNGPEQEYETANSNFEQAKKTLRDAEENLLATRRKCRNEENTRANRDSEKRSESMLINITRFEWIWMAFGLACLIAPPFLLHFTGTGGIRIVKNEIQPMTDPNATKTTDSDTTQTTDSRATQIPDSNLSNANSNDKPKDDKTTTIANSLEIERYIFDGYAVVIVFLGLFAVFKSARYKAVRQRVALASVHLSPDNRSDSNQIEEIYEEVSKIAQVLSGDHNLNASQVKEKLGETNRLLMDLERFYQQERRVKLDNISQILSEKL